jgi:acetyl esterase/lipase
MSASGSPFASPSSSSSNTPKLNPAKAPFDVEAYHGPVVLYLHGGGYCIGSKRTHRRMVGYISELSDAPVLSINYRYVK